MGKAESEYDADVEAGDEKISKVESKSSGSEQSGQTSKKSG